MSYVDTYDKLNKIKPNSIRSKLRNLALDGLSLLDKINDSDLLLHKPRIQFLYFHHVFSDERRPLEYLLKRLAMDFSFISYSEAVEKILHGDIGKPYIVFSSDDGLKNNLRSVEIFAHYGVKACFFINPYIVGQTNYGMIKLYCKERLTSPPVEFLNWADIEFLQNAGHEIGSHTMSHINAASTSSEIVTSELVDSYSVIMRRCGKVSHFAFPYGRFTHFNEIGRKAVFNAGFSSCASAERGCHINHTQTLLRESLCIRRDHIVLGWKLDHILHFIRNNSKKASLRNNLFPYDQIESSYIS